MSVALVGTRGGNTGKASQTTIQMTISVSTIPVNGGAKVRVVCDSIDATVGPTNHVSLADSSGNVWQKLWERQNGGGAGLGVIVAEFFTTVTTAMTVSVTTVTATFDTAVVARTINCIECSVAAGKIFYIDPAAIASADGTGTTPSVTIAGLANLERLWIGGLGFEGTSGDFSTEDADYTLVQSNGTSGAPVTDNVYSRTSTRVATLTGDTYAPTLANGRDWVVGLVGISEADPGGTTYNVSAQIDAAGDALATSALALPVQVAIDAGADALATSALARPVQVAIDAAADALANALLARQAGALVEGSLDTAATAKLVRLAQAIVDAAADLQAGAGGSSSQQVQALIDVAVDVQARALAALQTRAKAEVFAELLAVIANLNVPYVTSPTTAAVLLAARSTGASVLPASQRTIAEVI